MFKSCFEDINKDQISLNECCVDVSGVMLVLRTFSVADNHNNLFLSDKVFWSESGEKSAQIKTAQN